MHLCWHIGTVKFRDLVNAYRGKQPQFLRHILLFFQIVQLNSYESLHSDSWIVPKVSDFSDVELNNLALIPF